MQMILLVGDNLEEVESRYARWKKALQESGLRLLGAGCLVAAAYAPELLGAWTFRRQDF